MEKINDGGPAFPNVPEGAGARWSSWDTGMTLRDYFAAKALTAIISKFPVELTDKGDANLSNAAARGAYVYADAMIAARGAA